MKPESRVHLRRSERIYWLLDYESGRIVGRRWRPRGGPVEGVVRRCGFKIVATYGDPRTSMIHVKVGRRCYPADESTRAEHAWALFGLISRLRVERDGQPTLRAWDFVLLRRLGRIWNGDYEQPAALESDFLMNRAETVTSPSRREQIPVFWASERAQRLAAVDKRRKQKR